MLSIVQEKNSNLYIKLVWFAIHSHGLISCSWILFVICVSFAIAYDFIDLLYIYFIFMKLMKPATCCNLYRSLFSRKRTSIAAPEKRSLEAYFAVQPRPSGEKIAAIAEKLDLKKNVVRVWFCNQRQKQKRMKFAAQHWQANGTNSSTNNNNSNHNHNNNGALAAVAAAAAAHQLSMSGNNGGNVCASATTVNGILNAANGAAGPVPNSGFGY